MSGLTGYGVRDTNFTFRFFLIVFCGIIAFGAVLTWRTQLLLASDYQGDPITKKSLELERQNIKIRKQIELNSRFNLEE